MGIGGDDSEYEGERGRRYGDDGGIGPAARTRTRLPDGEQTDLYDGVQQRPVRVGRNLITVMGVVILLIGAIAFANRGGGTDDSDSGDTSTEAQPTAPTGKRAVTGTTNGIASGHPHTEQGAQSAAANYAVALGSEEMFGATRRQEIARAVYAPNVVSTRQKALDKAYSNAAFLRKVGLEEDGTAPDGMTFVSRVNPIGARVNTYDDATATVSVWHTSLFGLAGEGSTTPVSESWYTSVFSLQWVDNDWKVLDFSQQDGPTPVGRDQAASSAEDMVDAVEGFGGFTYAR